MAQFTALIQRRRRWFLLLLILVAYGLRVSGLDRQSLWRDEVDAIYFALRELPATLSMFLQAAQNGPLYFLGLRPWFYLMGTTEFVLRYPSVVAGTLSVPLLWVVARQLLPGRTGSPAAAAFLGALFMAVNPYQVWYGQEGKMYATITALALLATWLWWRGVSRGGWRPWAGYWVTVSAAMYIHLLMVLIIPLHCLWFWLAWPVSRKQALGYGLALAGLTLPYLPMAWWHWEMLTAPGQVTGFAFVPLPQMLEGLALFQMRGFWTALSPLWLAPVLFLFGAGLLLGVTEIGAVRPTPDLSREPVLAPWRRFSLIVSWLLAPTCAIFVLSLRQPIFTERYLIWLSPAAFLIIALGTLVLGRSSERWGPLVTGLALVYLLGLWGTLNWQQKITTIKYDLRTAVHYVHSRRQPEDLLILQIPHQEWSYRYYSSDMGVAPFAGSDERLGRWAGGPYTNFGQPDEQAQAAVDDALRSATAGVTDVWVLFSEAEMWDSRRLMDHWLDRHGRVIEQATFAGVEARRYVLATERNGHAQQP